MSPALRPALRPVSRPDVQRLRQPGCRTLRHGFTLVEMMVVIVIISIMMAFILPAIMGARRQARVTETSVDIKALESSITTFRAQFGIDPPSSITLYEQPTGNPSWVSDTADPTRLVRSRTYMRRLWPQFDFSASTSVPANSGWDINGDGDKTDTLTLTGPECLVFFLGGMTTTNFVTAADTPVTGAPPPGTPVSGWIPLGFSRNARNPFERNDGTRLGPFHEFDGTRLVNVRTVAAPAGPQYMPEYLDTWPGQSNPYLYTTSYDGRGYDAADLLGSGMTNVYLQKDDDLATIGDPTEVPWNQSGFQIISPGEDTDYGVGGLYDPNQLFDVVTYPNREFERDNITNFSSGELEN